MQRTIAEINLLNIRKNALKIKSLSVGAKFFAVVKADAYGHGAEEVSRCVEDIADGFCVAIIEEGIALRVAGIRKPVLVFTPPLDSYDVLRAKAYSLTLTVNSADTARLSSGVPCHIKVNTGMNRAGCNPSELCGILNILDRRNISGVYSHLYAACDKSASERQFKIFSECAAKVKEYAPEATAHVSASGGLLLGGKYICDAVRCGILLYGYVPEGFCNIGFKPAMKVFARKVQDTAFIGGGIGYNAADKNYGVLSLYRCGYADGFSRTVPLGEKTLCMDGFVSVSGGKYKCVLDNAEEYAKRCSTIPYEALVNATRRAERVYIR